MKRSEWHKTVRKGCKQKRENTDSSAYCVYCRRKGRKGGDGGVCSFDNCPIKVRKKLEVA